MAEQVHKAKQSQKHETETDESVEATEQRNEKLSDDIDAILEDIDDVLEENAEVFVRQYIQKGGEASELKRGRNDIMAPWTTFGAALSAALRFLKRTVAVPIYQLAVAA